MTILGGSEREPGLPAAPESIGMVQKTNLQFLEKSLRNKWNFGQNVLLCWAVVPQGIQVLIVPHYYLGKFAASMDGCSPENEFDIRNGQFVRELISGCRQLLYDDFLEAANRLELLPVQINLPVQLSLVPEVLDAVDKLIKRYSINFVKRRAVLLFGIVDFSLLTPFEQTGQLNSLSYSLNSACNKLLKNNIDISFTCSSTGDGYYVWNSDSSERGDVELFYFMQLVLADNAIAQSKASVNSVPRIRTGFHIGSHYEFCQAEGINPAGHNHIVGKVTIELAKMLEVAQPGQILIGHFETVVPNVDQQDAYLVSVDSLGFVKRVNNGAASLLNTELSGEQIEEIHVYLSADDERARDFNAADRHECAQTAYSLNINIRTEGRQPLILGKPSSELPRRKCLYRDRVGMNANNVLENSTTAAMMKPCSSAAIAACED